MLRSRKRFASLTLAAILLSWPAGIALALHEAHHHEAARPVLAAVVHGHGHEDGTPPHDHWLTPAPSVASVQLRAFVACTLRVETAALAAATLPPPIDAGASPGATGSPPARSASSKSILRI